jgi:uncharacterized membrane protein (UPF0127 family)
VIANRPWARMRGLLGHESLPAGEGLLLTPAPSVHTALMRFSIDVIFLDKELRVVKLVERLVPWRTASARRARAALELAAGEAARRGVSVGDILSVVDESDHDAQARAASARDATRLGSTGDATAGPTGVLLITSDRRFRSLAAALLTRRGCWVTSAERMTDVAELAIENAAEVVILDASNSLGAAAREAALIEALEPRIGVIMVADEAACAVARTLVLAKWQSFDSLYAEIEEARARLGVRCS